MNLKEFIKELKQIINNLQKSGYNFKNFEQDNNLKDYIENEVQIEKISAHPHAQSAYARIIVLHLRRFLRQLPIRTEGGFWSFFFKTDSHGELFKRIGGLVMRFAQSPEYKDAQDFEKITNISNATKLLDLSFMDITLDQLKKIKEFKFLEILNLTHIKIDGCILGELDDKKLMVLLEIIGSCDKLVSLNLSHNNLGECSQKGLKKLGKQISLLSHLTKLNLSNNNIQDIELLCFFGEIDWITNSEFKIDNIDLSCNLLSFEKYCLGSFDRHYNNQKKLLDELKKRNVNVDLFGNYINFYKNKGDEVQINIFEEYPIVKTVSRKIESLINPAYHIDSENGIVVIAYEKGKNHASILVHRMDDNDQLSLTKYHVTGSNSDCCGVEAKIDQFKPIRLRSFLKKESGVNFMFGAFYKVRNKKIDNLHDAIQIDVKQKIYTQQSKCLCSCCPSSINCYRYCIERINEHLALPKNITEPLILMPALDLTVVVEKTPERYSFNFGSSYTK